MPDDTLKIAEYATQVLPLESARLGDEYYYQSLSNCVIDAVFSIGVNYGSVQNVISRYCRYFGLPKTRSDLFALPSREEQESISSLCVRFEELGFGVMTEEVFNNRQRTSPQNGILKAEAVLEFASVLSAHQVEHFQDIPMAIHNGALERDIRRIPGQHSGKSLQYFWMLAGCDDLVKPDRMVIRFLEDALRRQVLDTEAQSLLSGAVGYLILSTPGMTARLLDHEIWKYQRARVGPNGLD